MTTTGRVASVGFRWAEMVKAEASVRQPVAITLNGTDRLIKRKERECFRKGRQANPLRAFAKSSASFAVKIRIPATFKFGLNTNLSPLIWDLTD
jgi:hypothetical protein